MIKINFQKNSVIVRGASIKNVLIKTKFCKNDLESSISKEKLHKLVKFSENICSTVHRLLLTRNADDENERIEIHLLETKQTTFHLHDSMIAKEKKKYSAQMCLH